MDGFVLNDEEVIEGIGGNKSKTNSVFKSSKKTILDEESFNKLLDDINNKIVQMAEDISSGEIGIKPKRIKDKTSCKYCLYGGICKFDSSIDGARYIKI